MSVLIGVLVVVAVVAWACSSGSDGPESTSSAQTSKSPTPVAAADPLLAGLRSLTMAPPTPSPTPSPSPTKSPSVAKPRKPGAPCDTDDLVLSLQGAQDVYGEGANPALTATLVNTSNVMCTTDVSPQVMEIRITSGEDRIWSTADCVAGKAGTAEKLNRGIPYVRAVSWDRKRTAASCASTRPPALPGTYVAVARMGKLKSPLVVFHLR
ncbi:hypothetical protein OIE66_42085 [Nonomuraea sp. NBC_01738]|uniref:hypothetical protein n=1 Tax=Nonomuraea sp. NBC_01738 TaxID=2976003 RepID=UPI002E0D82B1|nr:hypothetical protein OIE66_42085 [Nonomuraea sp. NBC_01738]